jgi:hypothetical protein
MTKNCRRKLLLLLSLLGMTACTPMHTVRPLPEFVELALEPGDEIVVTLLDGEQFDLTVSAVDAEAIEGDGKRIELANVMDIRKRAWRAPALPCGGEKPVGCSIPWIVQLASETTRHYKDQFHDACVQHDFCYRHGARSYGHTREDCDAEFHKNMLAACPLPARGFIAKAIDALNVGPTSRRVCIETAENFRAATRQFGERYFLTSQSTYCEYDGPPRTSLP